LAGWLRTIKKLFWLVFTLLPPMVMLLRNEIGILRSLESTVEYLSFLAASAISLLVFSIGATWKESKNPKSTVGGFLRTYVLNLVKGEVYTLPSVAFFVLMTAVLAAWLPDSFENGNFVLATGAIFYLAALVFGLYWIYEAPNESKELVPTRYLATALSRLSSWSAKELWEKDCESIIKNDGSMNILPLAVAIDFHLEKLERVYIFNSRQNEEKPIKTIIRNGKPTVNEEEKTFLENPPGELRAFLKGLNPFQRKIAVFFAKLSRCLSERGYSVKFRIHWRHEKDKFSGQTTVVGNGKRTIDVVFVPNVPYENIEEAREIISNAMRNIRGDEWPLVTYDLTMGTATMSVALALEAVKEKAQAEYLRQDETDGTNKRYKNVLTRVDVDPLSLLDIDEVIRRRLEMR